MSQSLAPGPLSDLQAPAFPATRIRRFLKETFQLVADTSPLKSERDQVLLVETGSGAKFILRISPVREPSNAYRFQNAVLASIARFDPLLPVPRLVPSQNGGEVALLADEHACHSASLYSFLPGEPLWRTARSPEQRASLGRMLARLDRALAQAECSSDGDAFLWNVELALNLRPYLAQVPDAELRSLASAVLDEFEENAQPRLSSLPRQIIHNDFNPKNVLVDPKNPASITGIIDFGDMVRAPRIIDLAVAVARQVTTEDPVGEASEIVAAYCSQSPVLETEIELLHVLVCVRLAMRMVIWGWRQAQGDPRCDPTRIATAMELLGAFRRAGAPLLTAACRRAFDLAR